MKRIIITGAALLAAIPASLGLMGNASFAQSVPVRVPSQATLVGGPRAGTPRLATTRAALRPPMLSPATTRAAH